MFDDSIGLCRSGETTSGEVFDVANETTGDKHLGVRGLPTLVGDDDARELFENGGVESELVTEDAGASLNTCAVDAPKPLPNTSSFQEPNLFQPTAPNAGVGPSNPSAKHRSTLSFQKASFLLS